jgi:hypothetical protein
MSTTNIPNPGATPAPRRRSPWAALRQPTFLVTAGILLAAALGLNSAIYGLALHFHKEPVPLAARLDDAERGLSRKLGHWVAVSKDEPLQEDLEHALGTGEYVFRTYVDSRVVDQATLDALNDKALNPTQRAGMIERVRQQYGPQAVLQVAVTYYTGLADTVAHIPERCMVADGYEPQTPPATHTADLTVAGRPRQIDYRFIHFQDQTGFRREDRNVAYFFHVNGKYASSPQDVRVTMQNLFERNAYYAKVELMNGPKDEKVAAAAMEDWMSQALPDLERVLPDWNKVKAKKST